MSSALVPAFVAAGGGSALMAGIWRHEQRRDEAMRASMLERFSEVESRIAELTRETERAQAAAIDDIGSAISQLGATIRNMSGGRKAH